MKNNIKRSKNGAKLNFLIVLVILAVLLNGIGVYYCKNLYELQKEDYNINEGYEEEDIESIEEVRHFFLCYYGIKKYGMESLANFTEYGHGSFNYILNASRKLLKKYSEIKLDEYKTLVYDEQTRKIQIVQDAFAIDTTFNVDILSSDENWWTIRDTVSTEKGTWAYLDVLEPKYVLYKFGDKVDEIKINDISSSLTMVELENESDAEYFLFKELISEDCVDYYIYRIEKNEWLKFNSIREIDMTDEFVSFIDSDNNFFVYCVEHNSKILVKTLEKYEELSYIYSNVIMPESIYDNEELREKLFLNHENCK